MDDADVPHWLQRLLVAGLAGVVPGLVLSTVMDPAWLGPAFGVLLGVLYGWAFPFHQRGAVDHVPSAATFGLVLGALVHWVLLPLAGSQPLLWSPEGVAVTWPALTGWVVAGVLLGALVPLLPAAWADRPVEDAEHRDVPPYQADLVRDEDDPRRPRIVILGGGFGGVHVASRLERLFGAAPDVELVLVSERNALLYTPMLSEVAAGNVRPHHISTPLRTALVRTRIIHGKAGSIDTQRRRVTASGQEVDYDHLVLAIGNVPDHKGVLGIDEHALDFKTLQDAMRIRNHVIACFERADATADALERRRLMTFVVAGGGFAGAELAGSLNDLVHGVLPHFPHVDPESVRVILVHSHETILPELGKDLGAYAQKRLHKRGVTFHLGAHVSGYENGVVQTDDGERFEAATLVWTVGNRPNPWLERIPAQLAPNGALVVDQHLRVPGPKGLWALGDCACVTDTKTGETAPATAQHALRQAEVLAQNLHAAIRGGEQVRYAYQTKGQFAVIGHQSAVAQIYGVKLHGLVAWWMWRAVYLAKLPSLDRRMRVLSDWVLDVFFPPDIVQTIELDVRPQVLTEQEEEETKEIETKGAAKQGVTESAAEQRNQRERDETSQSEDRKMRAKELPQVPNRTAVRKAERAQRRAAGQPREDAGGDVHER